MHNVSVLLIVLIACHALWGHIELGSALCTHYAQNGICKYGPSCKFDHPPRTLSYSPSASSLADMPIAPYPVGSSKGTLAPSSSSSELRPELISGTNKDALFNRMSSSVTTSSVSIGSMFSSNASASHATFQQSGQASTNSTASMNTSQGGQVRTSS
ncbi:unnamed protein product [Thlaspi arvense]|uniref:C3H1-type domain-containing protein n=1 Tax=Thlaspi arvense TaxID=13288 RepID=A0AAU9RT47_THLAR|nr:unnamed protein product [Thlaspi arvense]